MKFNDFETNARRQRRAGIGFTLWFAFCTILGLGMTAVAIWAVIKIVQWLTTQQL